MEKSLTGQIEKLAMDYTDFADKYNHELARNKVITFLLQLDGR